MTSLATPRRVLVVASKLGYQTRTFQHAASRLGLEPVMATDRCKSMDDPWGDQAIPLAMESPEESLRRLERFRRRLEGIGGIVAVGDHPAVIAAHLAQALGLRFHPPKAMETAHNKWKAREQMRAAGLPAPKYFRVPIHEGSSRAVSRAPWPCVLKPVGLSGSRGVIRANNPEEFHEAFDRIAGLLRLPEFFKEDRSEHLTIQVEEYLPGKEFAIEGLMSRGDFRLLAVFDKPDPLEGPFFEETLYITPSRESEGRLAAMKDMVVRALRALGFSDGPVHSELRVDGERVVVLEIAGRPIGGLCSRALQFNGGVSLEELILRNALGMNLSEVILDGPASGVMMIPIPRSGVYAGVEGLESARSTPGIVDVEITAKVGQSLLQLPEGSSYLGFLFARGGQPAAVEAALRAAHAELCFDIRGSLQVLPGSRF